MKIYMSDGRQQFTINSKVKNNIDKNDKHFSEVNQKLYQISLIFKVKPRIFIFVMPPQALAQWFLKLVSLQNFYTDYLQVSFLQNYKQAQYIFPFMSIESPFKSTTLRLTLIIVLAHLISIQCKIDIGTINNVQQSDDGHQEGSHNNKDTVNSNTKPYIEPSKAKTNIASNDKDNMVVTSTGKAINSKQNSAQDEVDMGLDFQHFDLKGGSGSIKSKVDLQQKQNSNKNDVSPIVNSAKLVIPESAISYDMFVQNFQQNSYTYKDPEIILYRCKILQQNIDRIRLHNSKPNISYTLDINQFAFLTTQQFRQSFVTEFRPNVKDPYKTVNKIKQEIVRSELFEVDWQCYDTTIFQGLCNSDYVVPVLNAIYLTIKIHQNQEIAPCGDQQRNSTISNKNTLNGAQLNGCRNGSMGQVFKYVQTKGIGSSQMSNQNEQPKIKAQTTKCEKNRAKDSKYGNDRIFIQGYGRIQAGDCVELIYRLRFRALAAMIDPTQLPLYQKGVIHRSIDIDKNSQMDTTKLKLTHGVTLVGYNPKTQVYKIKNSWGRKWGINGYAYATNSIGICEQAYYPILRIEKVLPKLCSQGTNNPEISLIQKNQNETNTNVNIKNPVNVNTVSQKQAQKPN